MSNPLSWPRVEHHRYVLEATSYSTALLIQDYPYGNSLRCCKRIWAEQSLKGKAKGRWRLVSQTTARPINDTYTRRLEEAEKAGPEALLAFQGEILTQYHQVWQPINTHPFWNKPDHATYHLFACWEQMKCYPVADSTEDMMMFGYQPFALTLNAKPAEMIVFLERVSRYAYELSAQQILSLRHVENIGRRYNAGSWPNPINWQVWGLPDG